MLIATPEAERNLTDERVRELYMSKWTIDNLTAALMDAGVGSVGLYEETARAKAAKILNWLSIIVKLKVPQKHE